MIKLLQKFVGSRGKALVALLKGRSPLIVVESSRGQSLLVSSRNTQDSSVNFVLYSLDLQSEAQQICAEKAVNMMEIDKMLAGEMYLPDDADIRREQIMCLERLYDFNLTRPSESELREKMLSEMFAEIGEECYIEPPLHANWGGKHVHFGNHVYANFNLTLVDDTHIYIGDCTMIGPNVTIATATHPIDPALREQAYQQNKPVTIGRNCWIGSGAIILPGVTIGENAVIGAGSVVTKNIPANTVAVGNPCRVIKRIDD